AFDEDRAQVIKRAKDFGITKILLPNIDSKSIQGMNALLAEDPTYFGKMMGLHPCSVDQDFEVELDTIKKELDKVGCIAVGEIGIDLYWDKTKKDFQEKAFLIQCGWAVEKNLPIAIHSRDSTDLIISLLVKHYADKLSGVFHCFGGTHQQALHIIDMGFYLGIGGILTFKNSNLRDELVGIPLERLVLETDAPYLAPVPYRGKRNESAYVNEVAKELAKVYSVSLEEVKDITTRNASILFKL
ncbi:TatD family hydrolase, partial [Bacteroidia bacterium]|nr:TatD family hydrolase [Bacteroidia bacterium]MDB9882494.1 TatD family hydrolase [Bacteroidia bacterium]